MNIDYLNLVKADHDLVLAADRKIGYQAIYGRNNDLRQTPGQIPDGTITETVSGGDDSQAVPA